MSKLFVAVLLLLTFLPGCGGGGSTSSSNSGSNNPPPQSIAGGNATVDFGNVHQTIRGFGGADAWINLNSTAEETTLFGTGSGQIGLSILRVRIDPSSTTGGSNWDPEVANAKAAIAAGSNVSIIATPWTPPAVWKTNSDVNNGGSLDPSHYGDYANYLERFVNYLANAGVNLYGISMQNEPDWTATYESCVWTPQQMDTWVANYASVLKTKLIMPESLRFDQTYSDPTLSDMNAVGKIAIIGGHLYGATPTAYPAAVSAGKDLWMTEHYLNPAGGSTAQPAVADALSAAKEIHDSLTVGQYNAYVWWWVANWNPGNPNTGLVDVNNAPTYYGWALAQFARFVRPGYVRTDATANPTTGVYVSAYKGNGHSVIVAINMGTIAVSQPFTIQNQSISSMVPYQTTASATVAPQSAVSISSNQFTYTLPAQSIITFVQ